KAHCDATLVERPQALAEPVVELTLPLAPQKILAGRPALYELRPVPPHGILRVGERNTARIAGIPCILRGLDLRACCGLVERRQRRLLLRHRNSPSGKKVGRSGRLFRPGPIPALAIGRVLPRPPAPTLAMGVLGGALDPRVPLAEQQRIRGAHLGADQAQVVRGVEEARIPAPPSGE